MRSSRGARGLLVEHSRSQPGSLGNETPCAGKGFARERMIGTQAARTGKAADNLSASATQFGLPDFEN
jgi:hypothetical protein